MLRSLIGQDYAVPVLHLMRSRQPRIAAEVPPARHRGTGLRRPIGAALSLGTAGAFSLFVAFVGAPAAFASQPTVGLGTAAPFAVLAATTVTNTGATVVSGDLGLSPGTAVTGFPPGQIINGTEHLTDATALQAQSDLTTAYLDAAGRTPATTVSSNLGGQTLAPGVYKATSGLALTGTVTLNANPNTVQLALHGCSFGACPVPDGRSPNRNVASRTSCRSACSCGPSLRASSTI